MNSNFLYDTKLKTASIQQVNDALIVLRHFVELNHRLLPLLYDLHSKTVPTEKDLADIQKIRGVFDSYQFDTNASMVLMDSPVLGLIRESYHSIIGNENEDNAKIRLDKFMSEFARLKSNWNNIRNN